jgi:hypothetical protein
VALADIVDQLRGLLELARLPEPGATKVHPLRSLVDVVTTGGEIATLLGALDDAGVARLLLVAAPHEADGAGDDDPSQRDFEHGPTAWQQRWHGLRPQFVSQTTAPQPGQAAGSRGAGAAIPQLLAVVATLNERRSNRSDRSADFRTLTTWLAR